MTRYLITLILLLFSLAHTAAAQITVDRNIIDLSAGTRRADIAVSNTGQSNEEVEISLFAISNPGLDSEQRLSVDNPRELGLLATPRRFLLEPGQSRKVRISFLKPATTTDNIYRMRVTPKNGSTATRKAPGTAVSIAIAYELLLILRPSKPDTRLEVNRQQNSLQVKNTGNSNAMLFDGKQCNAQGDNCKQLPGKRIYSGANHEFTLPYTNTPVSFMLNNGVDTYGVEY